MEFDPGDPTPSSPSSVSLARMIGATLRNTANPTVLEAGYKVNVIPQTATAMLDGRPVPGYEDEFYAHDRRAARPEASAAR